MRTAIEISTLSVAWATEWSAMVAHSGSIATESPVTGSRVGATGGTMSAFGYFTEHDARAEVVLAAFCSRVYRFSAAGRPATFKLLYNAWGDTLLDTVGIHLPRFSVLAEDFEQAQEILSTDGWMSLVVASKLDRIRSGQFENADFALRHTVKDLDYVLRVLGPGTEIDQLRDKYLQAISIYGPESDFSSVTAINPGQEA
ncbi:hypothetical protein KKI43_21475 [Arthrobacter sp. GN70]|nr:hypothetical protein [Arthrobacter sp. GN70]